jgi:hypothetical protein
MGTPPGWGLEHRASNPVSVKNLTAVETSTIVKFLRLYVPVGTKRTSSTTVACSLHSFVTKSYKYGILNATCKSRVGVRLGRLPKVRGTVFCRRCNFKSQLSATNSHPGKHRSVQT